jgi:hypothetical protein
MSDETFHGVGAELGSAAPCPTITYKEKVWQVGWPTQRARAQMEGLVIEAARRNLASLKEFLPPDEYQRQEAELRAAIFSGQWKTGGDLWQTVVQGRDSNTVFLLSLLREKHPEATWDVAEGMWADAPEAALEAFARVVPNFLPLLVEKAPGKTPAEKKELSAQFVTMTADVMQAIRQSRRGTSSEPTTPSA